MAHCAAISSRVLPGASQPGIDFLESSFFKTYHRNELPEPSAVKQLAPAGPSRRQPLPVAFEHLGLIVKYGPHVTISEAQNLWLLRSVLYDKVPVPEVYAWRTYDSEVFIYMQYIKGPTLQNRWDSLNAIEKASVCSQLQDMLSNLRGLRQDQAERFIGSVGRQRLQDYVFEGMPRNEPFSSVALFNEWFSWLPQRWALDSQKYDDPYRYLLPDDCAIVFTHSDLHRSNIMVSETNPIRVVAIIDWGQSGWYPEYWEYCKALYTASYLDEWRTKWIPRFLHPRAEEHEAFAEYVIAIGAV